jgi:hypothetical protein
MPYNPAFGVSAKVFNKNRELTLYHDHKVDCTANNGRCLTQLLNGQLVYLDRFEEKLRAGFDEATTRARTRDGREQSPGMRSRPTTQRSRAAPSRGLARALPGSKGQ